MDKSFYSDLRDIHGELQPVNLSVIEKAISEFFMSKEELQGNDLEFDIQPLSEEEINATIHNPNSHYHKILPGYMYKIYGHGTLCTGRGGAQEFYKAMLRQGMTEEMIVNTIYVHMDDGNEYPLSLLNVKKR